MTCERVMQGGNGAPGGACEQHDPACDAGE